MPKESQTILRNLGSQLGSKDAFLLGTDLVKDESTLVAARWDPIESRIEMHLESIRCQNVQVPAAGLELDFRNGETIHTENSYKFTDETLHGLLSDSGFQIETTWKDARHWYALTLSRRCERSRCD